MNRDDIIRMAREAGYFLYDLTETHGIKTVETDEDDQWAQLERFAALIAAAEREECAKVCEEKQEYSMPIACPDGISGCLVAHYVPARRDKTGSECAAAIRARGEQA